MAWIQGRCREKSGPRWLTYFAPSVLLLSVYEYLRGHGTLVLNRTAAISLDERDPDRAIMSVAGPVPSKTQTPRRLSRRLSLT